MNELLNDTINVHLFERKYFITNKVFCCAVWTKQRLLRNFAKTINSRVKQKVKSSREFKLILWHSCVYHWHSNLRGILTIHGIPTHLIHA